MTTAAKKDLVPGLQCAERLIDARLRTAVALGYSEVFRAALDEALVFIRAELYRQEHPESASYTVVD